MRNSNWIVHCDQTRRWEENFHRVDHAPCPGHLLQRKCWRANYLRWLTFSFQCCYLVRRFPGQHLSSSRTYIRLAPSNLAISSVKQPHLHLCLSISLPRLCCTLAGSQQQLQLQQLVTDRPPVVSTTSCSHLVPSRTSSVSIQACICTSSSWVHRRPIFRLLACAERDATAKLHLFTNIACFATISQHDFSAFL